VLDVDLHHGNGTQAIFYRRGDVMTVSIHADPSRFYPFFWGYANETGEADGAGCNLNLPLPRGSGDREFLAALDTAIGAIRAFGDPFGGLRVTTGGFGEIGQRVAAGLRLPTLLVQEGGYLCDGLGANLSSFLRGFGGA
jgi:acetoin utilization deacetylase AcuC-like enzyme